MTPADLRALLEKASPRPWRHEPSAHRPTAWGDVYDPDNMSIVSASNPTQKTIVAVMNLAPLLIELWEAARWHMLNDQSWFEDLRTILDKLEKA